jgi:serine/threonine protein kinase
MNDWKLLSSHPYGHVYEKDSIILKIIPESQIREVNFWKKVKLQKDEKKYLVCPTKIEYKKDYKLQSIPMGNYFLLSMEKKQCSLSKYLTNRSLTLNLEKKIYPNIIKALQLLGKQGFVHADMHLENIMKDKSNFCLIDFGLVMHKDFYETQQETKLCDLYLWCKEDFYSLCLVLLFHDQKKLLVKNNDYSKYRKKWIKYFSKNPTDWAMTKKNIFKTFCFDGREDFLFCYQFCFQNILSPSSALSPKPGVHMYDMLTKVFLDRIFLMTSIWFPQLVKLELSPERQKFYKQIVFKI